MLAGCASLISPRHRLRGPPVGSALEQQTLNFPLQDTHTHRYYFPHQRSGNGSGNVSMCGNEEKKDMVLLQARRQEDSCSWADQNQNTIMAKNAEALWEQHTSRNHLKRMLDDGEEDAYHYHGHGHGERSKRQRSNNNNNNNSNKTLTTLSINELGSHFQWSLEDSYNNSSSTNVSSTVFTCDQNSTSSVPSLPLQAFYTVGGYEYATLQDNIQRRPNNNGGLQLLEVNSSENNNNNNNNNNSESADAGNGNGNHGGGGGGGGIGSHEEEEYQGVVQEVSGARREQCETEQGLELVDLLVCCAEAMSSGNLEMVTNGIARLGHSASPQGSTPIHRMASYFTEAMVLRACKQWQHVFHPIVGDFELSDEDLLTGFQLLNHISPIPKFLHYTANETILRAFEGKDRVHIIDLDINQGLQWPALFHGLASRRRPPSHVRVTGIGQCKEDLQDTGERLARFAEEMRLPFEFHGVTVERLEEVRVWMLHVKKEEAVAVNCMLKLHQLMYDEGEALRGVMDVIKSAKPVVVTITEQEAAHDSPVFEERFLRAMEYYAAMFDMVDASLPGPATPARAKMEQYFAREIRNIVACEGRERIERHKSSSSWCELMQQEHQFVKFGIGQREWMQGRMLLDMYQGNNYRLSLSDGPSPHLTLSWLHQPLFTVSAWIPSSPPASASAS